MKGKITILICLLFPWSVFAQVAEKQLTENDLEKARLEIENDLMKQFDLEERSLELRFEELKQANEERIYYFLGGAAMLLALVGIAYKDILSRARKEVDSKVDKVIDERIPQMVDKKVVPEIRESVRREVRSKINDLNLAAAHFAFEEQTRKSQPLLVLFRERRDGEKMEKLLRKLKFEKIRISPVSQDASFELDEIIIFADAKAEMKGAEFENYLEKWREDTRFIYYGPTNNEFLKKYWDRFSASNNVHTLWPRIIEAVRFRDLYQIGPGDDILSNDSK
ncbi:MAG: hypothetical protein H6581_21320 [Bacteroidia bacterium]|nr:hypothetical protein [Bacteroidia bacterium]